MTSTISDAEIEKAWNGLDLDERSRLLRKIGYREYKSGSAVFNNWIAVTRRVQAKIRKELISGNYRGNHHTYDVGANPVATAPTQDDSQDAKKGKSTDPRVRGRRLRVGRTTRHHFIKVQNGRMVGKQRHLAKVIKDGKACQRCEIMFGKDGKDSEQVMDTGWCFQCFRETMTGKIEANWDGGERYRRIPSSVMGTEPEHENRRSKYA